MMRLLMDTHVFLWWLADDPSLGEQARTVIAAGHNLVYVSAATSWEISIKRSIGKLEAPPDIDNIVEEERFLKLPITLLHGQHAGQLPHLHRDPFDRMLVAQARVEGLTLVTNDPNIKRYDVALLWAG